MNHLEHFLFQRYPELKKQMVYESKTLDSALNEAWYESGTVIIPVSDDYESALLIDVDSDDLTETVYNDWYYSTDEFMGTSEQEVEPDNEWCKQYFDDNYDKTIFDALNQ